MNLGSLDATDIVRIDRKGRRFFAIVESRDGRDLCIRPLDKRISYRSATSNEVIGIWKANTETRRRHAGDERLIAR